MASQTTSQLFADREQLRSELKLADPMQMTAEQAQQDPVIQEQADDIVARILNTDAQDGQATAEIKGAVESMGMALQKDASHRSAILKQPLTKLMNDSEDGGQVATSLIDLKMTVEDLDPAQVDLEAGFVTRLLGYLPGVGTPLKRYFSRFENASTSIDAIINSLEAGREQLKRDNMILTDDQQAMRDLTKKLEKTVKLGQLIDKRLQDALDTELTQDSPNYKFISEELLFPLRQRIQDLQQQLIVNQQGYLTTEMIVRNNKELMRGVNRALHTTVSALQVGITLALALANQKIVLEKVQAINETTENLIAGTAKRLRTQGAEIQKQASATTLNMDVLKQSFADITAALDDISTFRQNALPQMAENILELDNMATDAEKQIKKVEKAENVTGGDFSLEIIE
ncbi:MAG: toxic anion resistance protein [Desulfobulbaceae bacterium]|nr:toxic anion resistance protein [Desulfobulbaceae bacterium]